VGLAAQGLRLVVDSGEVDHRYVVLGSDQVAIDARQHVQHLIGGPEFGILSFDVAGREFGNLLHLDPVENGGVEFLPAAKSWANRDPNDHSGLIFIRLVSQSDGDRLTIVSKHVPVEIGVKVKREHRKHYYRLKTLPNARCGK